MTVGIAVHADKKKKNHAKLGSRVDQVQNDSQL